MLVYGLVFGLIGSKLVYYVTQFEFVMYAGLVRSLYDTGIEYWSFFGGAAGAAIGVMLAARNYREHPMRVMNSFAPFAVLAVAAARFGYQLMEKDMVGFGSYVSQRIPFFTVVNDWGEAYWAVYRMEAVWALLILAATIIFFGKDTFLRAVFYLCIGQIFFESLHSDSLRWLFVRIEQLACMITAEAILIRNCIWRVRIYQLSCLNVRTSGNLKCQMEKAKQVRWDDFLPAIIGLLCAGVFVAVEFALDKTDWPIPAIYGTMIAGIAAMAVTECWSQRRMIRGIELEI